MLRALRALLGLLGALLRLALLIGFIVGFAQLLLVIDGPPPLPARWPDLDEVAFTLQLGGVPNDVLLYLLAQLLWLLLGYLVLALLLEAAATVVEVLAVGVAGARRLRRTSDAVAPGFIRRAVPGIVMALLTFWLSFRPTLATDASHAPAAVERVLPRPAPAAPPAAAGQAPAPPTVERGEDGRLRLLGSADAAAIRTPGARHTVVRGD